MMCLYFTRLLSWIGYAVRRDVFALVLLALLLAPGGCFEAQKRGPSKPQGDVVKAAAGEIGSRAASIDRHADAIDKKAPEVKPETDGIRDDTGALRAVQSELGNAQKTIAAREAECEKLREKVGDLERRNADLKAEQNSLLKRALQALSLLALVGVPVCVVWLRSLPGAATCAGVFAACIAGVWLIAWAKWIALGSLIVVSAVVLWAVFVQHKSIGQLVQTGEEWKAKLADGMRERAKEAANKIQSGSTQRLVAQIRKKLGVA